MRDSENPETLRFHPEPSKDQSGAQDANGYNENCPDKRHSIQMLYAGQCVGHVPKSPDDRRQYDGFSARHQIAQTRQ